MQRNRRRNRARRQQRLRTIKIALAVTGACAVAALAVAFYYARDLPSVEALRSYEPAQTTWVLDRNDKPLGAIYEQRRTVVELDRVPRVMVLSVLAAEDADFYEHEGLDYPGILRAITRDLLARRAAQGASTITQQVVKLLLLSPERTLSRKVKELFLARRLEQELSKDEILHLYLNHINFGHGRYGVQEASQFYFGKDVEDLDLAEASLLAGLPQAPGRLSPRRHPERARRRQLFVLDQLEKKRAKRWPDLTLEQIEKARQRDVQLVERDVGYDGAPEVLAIVREALIEQVGKERYATGGFTVHTTVDRKLQQQARRALQEGLRAIDARHGYHGPLKRRVRRRRRQQRVGKLRYGRTYFATVTGVDAENAILELDVGGHPATVSFGDAQRYNPKKLSLGDFAQPGARVPVSIEHLPPAGTEQPAHARLELGPQGAVVVIEPRSRHVLALVGGYEAEAGFNRAVQALRQPGSTFKPLVYAYAIKSRKFSAATQVLDAPAVYDEWKPDNFETWSYSGAVRLREALARSINLVAVRVIEEVGPEQVVHFAKQMGITSELDPSLALALGASEVRPIELTNAYATFASSGRWKPWQVITEVTGPDGDTIELAHPPPARDVLSPQEAYVVTHMLKSVVAEGTAQRALRLGRPAAGKTGTSNEARDAWFVGYTPQVVAGVWVGFDDRRPLGRRESGGRAALPIWLDVVEAASQEKKTRDFPRPTGVAMADIDPSTGLLAYPGMEGAVEEVFVEGTVPTDTARPPDVVDSKTFVMEQYE